MVPETDSECDEAAAHRKTYAHEMEPVDCTDIGESEDYSSGVRTVPRAPAAAPSPWGASATESQRQRSVWCSLSGLLPVPAV